MPRRAGSGIIDCAKWLQGLRKLIADATEAGRNGQEPLLRAAGTLGDALPRPLRAALDDFRRRGNRDGYLLLRAMPFGSSADCEGALALIGSRLGDFVGYAQEKNGALFHDVVPEREQEREQSAAGSRIRLELHTERCFHPYLPGYVMLACLRPDPARKALTEVASVRRLLAKIPIPHRATLFRPEFRTGIDYSFGNVGTEKGNGPVLPVLYGKRSDPFFNYDLDLMVGLGAPARAALAAVKRAALEVRDGLALTTGDLLVIDNLRAAHGRTAFRARYDGRDRWLKRAYLVRDLAAVPDRLPGDRVVRTTFLATERAGISHPAPK